MLNTQWSEIEMNNYLTKGLVLLGAGFAAAASHAGLVDIGDANIQFANPIHGPLGSDTVKVRYRDNNGNFRNLRTAAGRFSGSASSDDFDADILYSDADNVLLYCIDLFQRIGSGWNVDYDVNQLTDQGANTLSNAQHLPERDFDRTLDFLGALNHTLATSYGFGEGPFNWLNPSSSWMSGAIQLGIWESLYEDFSQDDTNWDIAAGDFSVVGTGGDRISSQGASFLGDVFGNIGSTDALATKYVLVLTNGKRQDMIVGDPPVNVPVPATATLLMGGLFALRRRRRS